MPDPKSVRDEEFMHAAVALAAEHMRALDGGPFGAIVVQTEHALRAAAVAVLDEWRAMPDKIPY